MVGNSLWSERGDEKTVWGTASGNNNVELRKLMAILVLYNAMVLSRC